MALLVLLSRFAGPVKVSLVNELQLYGPGASRNSVRRFTGTSRRGASLCPCQAAIPRKRYIVSLRWPAGREHILETDAGGQPARASGSGSASNGGGPGAGAAGGEGEEGAEDSDEEAEDGAAEAALGDGHEEEDAGG